MSTTTAPRRTQAERREESRARILDAATELFAERGYVRTTLDEIGARAGFTGALVSKRFGSKADLLGAVLDATFESIVAENRERVAPAGPPIVVLERYIEAFLARIEDASPAVRALYVVMGESLGAVPEIRDRIAAFNRQTIERVGLYVQDAIDAGDLRDDVDATSAATALLGLLRGRAFLHLADPGQTPVGRGDLEASLFLDGLRRPTSDPRPERTEQ